MAGDEQTFRLAAESRAAVQIAVFALGVSCVMTQLALMRELLCAFAGNELVLGIVLGNWLLLMGLGSALGRRADRLEKPVAWLCWSQVLIAVLPLAQVFAVRALRNAVFTRGVAIGAVEAFLSCLLLLAPYCLLAGFMLALACSVLSRGQIASGAGGVYVADSVGSIAGGILFSFVLTGFLDHIALLAVPAVLNLVAAAWIGRTVGRVASSVPPGHPLRWEIFVLMLVLGGSSLFWFINADALSTALQFSGQNVLFRANSPYGRLVVTESAGQTNFIENGVAIISTPDVEQVEESAHYAMAQRLGARRVLLISGGVAGVAKEILKYNVAEVDCVELDPLVIETGRRFLPDHFADARIHVIATDARRYVRQTTKQYDVVILALPDPSTAQLNRSFTVEFFREVRRVLLPEGVLSLAVGHYENFVSPELARLLATARVTLSKCFTNVLLLSGGRVFFLASDGSLTTDIAGRLEAAGVQTRLVKRHYLDAMLTPDRLSDVENASEQPGAVNHDFHPVLYFYHLQHWLSQFETHVGVLLAVALVATGFYAVRLRPTGFTLLASGFAGSALEMVLLLALQVLSGSLYQQVGVIVTVFMVGLAVGAAGANRLAQSRSNGALEFLNQPDSASGSSLPPSATPNLKRLSKLAFAIAVFAGLLPLFLPVLNSLSRIASGDLAVQVAIALLTFVLAALVGAQFPLANRIEYDGTNVAASRLYTADFIGAFLGALLVSTLLIPLIGVTGVCLLTAVLNALAGGVMFWRKVSA